MKIGGGLHYVDGPQGHGKSYWAARRIARALVAGRYVVTNIPLMPDWSREIANHTGLMPTRARRLEVERRCESLYVFTEKLGDVFRFDIPCKYCGQGRDPERGKCVNGHSMGEGRALGVWDESHNDVNNRDWQKSERELLLKGATQLRKLGYEFYLVTQHKDNTDAALRRVCGWRIRLTNLREHARGPFGIKVIPFNLFIAAYYQANTEEENGVAETYERFLLGYEKNIYDTHGIFSGLYDDLAPLGDRVPLPKPGTALPRRSRGEVVPALARSGRWWDQDAEALPELAA